MKNTIKETTTLYDFIILTANIGVLIILFWFGSKQTNVYLNGKVVTAEVHDRSCGIKNSWLYLMYENKEHNLEVGIETCQSVPNGTKIKVRLLPNIREAQYPNSNPLPILLIGTFFFVSSFLYILCDIIKSMRA
jgi:hypothetical protein